MPRTSIEALMIEETGLAPETRADAPYDLGDEESEEWRAIVNCMAPDHFIRANYPVLAQLCKHIVEARYTHRKMKEYRKANTFNVRVYAELTKVQDAQSLAIARLSRAMRLTQQANFHQSRRLPKPSHMKPTKDDDEW